MAKSANDVGRGWGLLLAAPLLWGTACGDDGSGASGETGNGSGTDETGTVALPEGCDFWVEPSEDDQTAVQEALIDVQTGQTVCLSAGTFSFTRQLSLDADGVTVTGEGGEATILDFSAQISGGNGMTVSGDDVTVQDLRILNTPGDGIRADNVENISFLGMHVIWEAEQSLDAGAYGFYPVQSEGVIIRDCLVQGSRDAGVYVGQSSKILVENNEARGNVAGIEIENSTDAIVRNNWAHDNTAGILVFNLPGLDIGDGKRANVYGNVIENNNVPNFGEPGTVVALLPPGVGVIVIAADDNEIWDNEIRGNESVGVVSIAYIDELFSPPDDPAFDIYDEGNWFHDNTFEANGTAPADLILLITEGAVPSPDIILGGCTDPDKDAGDASLANCVSGQGDATFVSANLCGQGMFEESPAANQCEHAPLPTEL